MNKLHPGARWSFRIRSWIVMVFLSFFLAWFIVPAMAVLFSFIGGGSGLSLGLIVLAVFVYLIFIIVIGEIYTRMAYNRWFYEFTDEELRLERGIIWKRYSNVPYERIQNVDVHRGIIARMFGFSSLRIQTAGFSGPAGAEGNIPAVEMKHAEEIRNFVMKKITSRKR